MRNFISLVLFCILTGATFTGCAYRLGSPERRIPGGYTLIAVPMFTNKTQEVGIESLFTQAMRKEVERSSLARVTSKEESQAVMYGEIVSIRNVSGSEVTKSDSGYGDLPIGVVLTKEYRIFVETKITLKRSSDLAVLWQGGFVGERRYSAPAITKQPINTADPLYNHSAIIQNIQLIADDSMAQAFEQLSENF